MINIDDLGYMVAARYPVICVVTHEEVRFLGYARDLFEGRKILVWSCTDGMMEEIGKDEKKAIPDTSQINQALQYVKKVAEVEPKVGRIVIVKDPHPYMQMPLIRRLFRDLSEILQHTSTTVIMLSPEICIPTDLEKSVALFEFPLPDKDEMLRLTMAVQQNNKHRIKVALKNGETDSVANACLGLTRDEAENVLSKSVSKHGTFNLKEISAEKKQIIRKAGLEFKEPEITMKDLGGMENLKEYFLKVKKAMTDPKARDYPLPNPKGIFLIGPPGSGKSALSEAIAHELQVHLIEFDLGALMGSLVGETEAKVRNALSRINSIGPCVCRFDEFEKMFAGMMGSATDSGTSQRACGAILTWFQERRSQAYSVATANRMFTESGHPTIPPESLRKGRWDEIWFIDLPTKDQRAVIAGIHLKKRKRKPEDFNLETIADACNGFSGAEIEQAVVEGMFSAFYENRDVSEKDVVAAMRNSRPLSETMKEELERIRDWAKNRARPASQEERKIQRRAARTVS